MTNLARFAFICTAAASFACATSPTGRKQLLFMPESEMAQLGAASFAELKKQTPPSKDPRINAEVQCVSRAIIAAIDPKYGARNWEVVVFDDESPNAFALPGNKIGVHTGMLKVAKTPDQLAAVIGHEVGHVLARHGNERISTNFAAQGGLALAAIVSGAAAGGEASTKRDLILAALGVGAQVGVLLPFSRKQESESDTMGLQLMARAGFNPQEAVTLWKNMEAAGGGQPPEFLSTHPSHGTRIRDLQAQIPKAMPAYQARLSSGARPSCPAT